MAPCRNHAKFITLPLHPHEAQYLFSINNMLFKYLAPLRFRCRPIEFRSCQSRKDSNLEYDVNVQLTTPPCPLSKRAAQWPTHPLSPLRSSVDIEPLYVQPLQLSHLVSAALSGQVPGHAALRRRRALPPRQRKVQRGGHRRLLRRGDLVA